MTTSRGRSLSVLVVDNVADAADSLAHLLVLHGHRAVAAYDAAEALRRAAADPPDAVLTDLAMPRMDGWELARKLREQAGERSLFVVAVTGLERADHRLLSGQAGIDLHLVKPVDPAAIVAVLSRLQ